MSDEPALQLESAFTPSGEPARSTGDPLSPRLAFLQRLVGEGCVPGEGLRIVTLAALGRPRRDPLTVLLATTSVPATADAAVAGAGLDAEMQSALDDHAPGRYGPCRRSERRAIARASDLPVRARLRVAAPGGLGSNVEIYLLAGFTVERALRRVRSPVLLLVSFLLLPRLRDVPLTRVTDGPPFGRLVAPAASGTEPAWPTHRRDAADAWPVYVRIELRSGQPIPPALKAALAADLRGPAAVAAGTAAFVHAEWDDEDVDSPPDGVFLEAGVTAVDVREAACLLAWPEGRADGEARQRLREVPDGIPTKGIVIGRAAGTHRAVAIPPDRMFEHVVLNGGSGVGKSVTLNAMLRSAARASWVRDGVDRGRAQIWLFDPHGSTGAAYAAAADGSEDVILWDASDGAARWDFFGSEDPAERLRMVDPFVASQWEQWDPTRSNQLGMGPRAEQMLRATATAVASHPRATLANAYDLLHDQTLFDREYRRWVTDPVTLTWFETWWSSSALRSNERGDLVSYYSSKTAVLSEAGMRGLWGPPGTGLNIRAAMRAGTSVLVVVRRSVFGPARTSTLIRLMKRCLSPELTSRDPNDPTVRPVIVATDEAAAYETQLDREWLAEMRKHSVGVILAFQDFLGQASQELVDSVAQNAAHFICFRSPSSPVAMATLLGDSQIAPELMKLGRGSAIARIGLDAPQPPILVDTPRPLPFSKERYEAIREKSRVRWSGVSPSSDRSVEGAANESGAHLSRSTGSVTEGADSPTTAGAILQILRDAGVSAGIDGDGDVVVEWPHLQPFWAIVRGREVRLYAVRPFTARSSRRARLDLANRINDSVKVVRATADLDHEQLVLDWYLPARTTLQPAEVRDAVFRFATLVRDAVDLDVSTVLDRTGSNAR